MFYFKVASSFLTSPLSIASIPIAPPCHYYSNQFLTLIAPCKDAQFSQTKHPLNKIKPNKCTVQINFPK